MATWPGWIGDILSAGGWPKTPQNEQFLSGWALYQPSGCDNNPLLASRHSSGSSNCKHLTAVNTAQNYPTRAQAVNATVAQLKSDLYVNIAAALKDGNPYKQSVIDAVYLDLRTWGAERWAQQYAGVTGAGVGGGGVGGGGPTKKQDAMGAWTRWMRALGHQLPQDVREINKATARLRRIAR